MRKINFRKIQASGFLSLADPISLEFEKGFYTVTGENLDDREDSSNGTGKTSLFSVLDFALYGEAKGLKKSEIPFNGKARVSCVTVVEFDIDEDKYQVVRKLNPSALQFKKNGKDLTQSSAATQLEIEKTIGIPYYVFNQCLSLKVNDQASSFVKFKKVEREKFVNVVFDLSRFKNMEKLVRSDLNLEKNKLEKRQIICDGLIENGETLKRQITTLQDEFDNRSERTKNKIKEIKSENADKKKELDAIEKFSDEDKDNLEDNLKDLTDKSVKLQKMIDTLKGSITTYTNEIVSKQKQLESLKKDSVCGMCKRPMDNIDDVVLENAEKDVKKIEKENNSKCLKNKADLKKAIKIKTTLRDKVDRFTADIRAGENRNSQRTAIDDQIRSNDKQIDFLKNTIEEQKEESGLKEIENDYKNNEQKIKLQKKENDAISVVIDQLEKLKIVTSETGVRQHILEKLINFFNKRLTYYNRKFENPFTITFDGGFTPTILNDKGLEVSYQSLSGGEQKRVDIAVSFTFRDVLKSQNQISFNFCVYDEIFDTSIDSRGRKKILEHLTEELEADDSSIFLITHKNDLEIENVKNIHLIKKDKKTTLSK